MSSRTTVYQVGESTNRTEQLHSFTNSITYYFGEMSFKSSTALILGNVVSFLHCMLLLEDAIQFLQGPAKLIFPMFSPHFKPYTRQWWRYSNLLAEGKSYARFPPSLRVPLIKTRLSRSDHTVFLTHLIERSHPAASSLPTIPRLPRLSWHRS